MPGCKFVACNHAKPVAVVGAAQQTYLCAEHLELYRAAFERASKSPTLRLL